MESSFKPFTTSSPEIYGPLSSSLSHLSPEQTVTILPPEATRFPTNDQPWLSPSPLQRLSPQVQSLDNNNNNNNNNNNRPPPHTPRSPVVAHFDPSNEISFDDPVLFPSHSRAAQQNPSPRAIPNQVHQPQHPRSASLPQPRRVSEIVQGLGYSTTPSSFSHRTAPQPSYQQFTQTQSSDSLLLQPEPRHQQQQPILDPQTAAAYFKNLSQQQRELETTIRTYKMQQQEHMKAFDPEAAFNELFSPDMSGLGSEFSSPQFTSAHDFSIPTIGPTISPQELLMNPPASAATTHLTSPLSFFDSPSESYDTSPLFAPDDVSPDNNWYSLFPETNPDNDDSSVSPPLPSQNQDHSPAPGSGYSDDDILDQPDSPGTSPIFRSSSSGPQRRSVTSGVRKNRGPLPPIVVEDPSDTVAMKRARNTLAARKSRAKKLERMEEMEVEIEKLKAQVEHWKNLAMNQNRRRS